MGSGEVGPGRRPGVGARQVLRRRVRRHSQRGQVVGGRVESGSRPAAGRPEGLALTAAVVMPGDWDHGHGPVLGRGLLAVPVGHSVVGRGTVNLASVLERARGGQPGVGCRWHTFVTPRPGGDHEAVRSRPRRAQSFASTTPLVGHAVPELRRGRARHHAASVARQRISPSRRP